jgi:hypothetical protein
VSQGFKSYNLVRRFLFLGNAGVSCCPEGGFVRLFLKFEFPVEVSMIFHKSLGHGI